MDSVSAHSGIPVSDLFDSYTGLIAVFHALHRLLAPRHPPQALSSLAALILPLSSPTRPLGLRRGLVRRKFSINFPSYRSPVASPRKRVTILFSLRAHAETHEKLQRMPACADIYCILVSATLTATELSKNLPWNSTPEGRLSGETINRFTTTSS